MGKKSKEEKDGIQELVETANKIKKGEPNDTDKHLPETAWNMGEEDKKDEENDDEQHNTKANTKANTRNNTKHNTKNIQDNETGESADMAGETGTKKINEEKNNTIHNTKANTKHNSLSNFLNYTFNQRGSQKGRYNVYLEDETVSILDHYKKHHFNKENYTDDNISRSELINIAIKFFIKELEDADILK